MIFPINRRTIALYRGELFDIVRLFFKGEAIEGNYIDLFTKEFSRYIDVRHSIPTATGRSALYFLLKAFDFSHGSEVILPAYEDLSVPQVIHDLGLNPVFADIHSGIQDIDSKEIEKKISDKTAAIVAAHLFGNPCDMRAIKKIAQKRGIVVIEDCAHAMGTTIDGKHTGTFGDGAFFSFHTTKPFMTFGGGMVVTDNDLIAERVKKYLEDQPMLKNIEIGKRIISAYLMSFFTQRLPFAFFVFPWFYLSSIFHIDPVIIYNKTLRKVIKINKRDVKFSNVQALAGLKHLRQLDLNVKIRRLNAFVLDTFLSEYIKRPIIKEGSNYYFYVIFSNERDKIRRLLLEKGLDTGKDLMRYCPPCSGSYEEFPNTKRVIEQSIQIPVYETLHYKTIIKIAEIINVSAECSHS